MNEGQSMYEFTRKIFPIHRSLTGDGLRKTLACINDEICKWGGSPLDIHEVSSGTQVFDWTIPKEWKIRDAYIEDEKGNRIIDYKNNNLHVLGYSLPVNKWVSLDELKEHLYTQEDQPEVIPYITSYYKERWGFCMSENQKLSLKDGKYHVYVDSELFDGNLTYGEVVIKGACENEVLFSTYICHPSMANNECSGPALAVEIIKYLVHKKNLKYTYRFLFIPETIGSITYLSRDNHLDWFKEHMLAGFVLTCVGDDRSYSMVETKYADTYTDKVLDAVLRTRNNYKRYSFLRRGSDERQFNAPGVDLPVVSYSRTKYHEYPEYHTSADNMDIVSPSGFQGSFDVMKECIEAIEIDGRYKVTVPCEPNLGKRGLYPTTSQKFTYGDSKSILDFLAYADGRNDLFDISRLTEVSIDKVIKIAEKLIKVGLIAEDTDRRVTGTGN